MLTIHDFGKNKFAAHSCPVCGGRTQALDVVDFNKSCEEARGKFLPLSGVPIYYFMCDACGFSFSPEIYQWSFEDFERYIYNDEYKAVDPDYSAVRPTANAKGLQSMFGVNGAGIRHLDYGGGDGFLSRALVASGWDSTSYDPFVDHSTHIETLGKFKLITVFEVFEHVPDVHALVSNLSLLIEEDGLIIFTTLLSDGQLAPAQRITWGYASPRNGHISLFSQKSLGVLAASQGFQFQSFSEGIHVFWKVPPKWAAHIFQPPQTSSI